MPTLPPDNDVVVMASAVSMTMVSGCDVTVVWAESVTLTVIVEEPVAVAVPVMLPVAGFRIRPVGNVPRMMLQV